ncbi:MAG: ABC transporter permease subunit [Bacillota bacterium]|nr:ABC transporter permease subunit [Bacillota bacterium]
MLISAINETNKIISKKKFIILFSLSILITVAAAIINMVTGRTFGVSLLNNSTLPVTVLNFMSSIILPLFIIMLTTDLFSGEFSDNSIIMSLVRPISRFKIYISKIISIGICALIFLLGTFIISFIASLFGGNFSDIVSRLPINFVSYICAAVPMLLIAIISAFVSQFSKSGALTIVIMILASVLMSSVSIFIPQLVPFVPSAYLDWYKNFYSGVEFTHILNEFLYILAYGIIFMSAGSYLFQQRDI